MLHDGPLPWVKPGKVQKAFELGEYVCSRSYGIDEVLILSIPSLVDRLPDANAGWVATKMLESGTNVIDKDFIILGDIVRVHGQKRVSRAFVRAGMRPSCFFDPATVRACVVTCGGLCPGLNNVIRQIVLDLYHLYGVTAVFGIRNGFDGFHSVEDTPVMLTPESVAQIHHLGGSVLGAGRGGFSVDKILAFLQPNGINQVYVIGGDGTMRAANILAMDILAKGLAISVCGVPKTIDNDIGLIDRSFGFTTSVAEAQHAIDSAKVEAMSAQNGIGVVKLMGREAGFITAHAVLASCDVDLCLIPEIPVVLHGPNGICGHLERVLHKKRHAVLVMAEGSGQELLPPTGETDAGGNPKLAPIGPHIVAQLNKYFKERATPVNIKYIDPSYIIRSVPANPSDSMYCMQLAQNAVHGCMAGFTAFTVALVNNRLVYISMKAICENSPRVMDGKGRTWERVLSITGQPNTAADMDKQRTHTISGAIAF